jgi:carboxyl-terminal processing protease
MSGKLEGMELVFKENDFTEISELISGWLARKQLEAGDLVMMKVAQGNEAVDVVGMRLDDVVKRLRAKGSEVRLTVKKVDGRIEIISIIRILWRLKKPTLNLVVTKMD